MTSSGSLFLGNVPSNVDGQQRWSVKLTFEIKDQGALVPAVRKMATVGPICLDLGTIFKRHFTEE